MQVKFELLQNGDIIEEGVEWYQPTTDVWYPEVNFIGDEYSLLEHYPMRRKVKTPQPVQSQPTEEELKETHSFFMNLFKRK